MLDALHRFGLCFVPLFVAMDPIGLVPIFLALTQGASPERTRRAILQSVVTAGAVALLFVAVGSGIFALLGITPADFMIAGGSLLFLIALHGLTREGGNARTDTDTETIGAVPLGVPLITGPAVLATLLLLAPEHGVGPAIAAFLANLLLIGVVLWQAPRIYRVLGKAGSRAVTKVVYILLAAIAVMIVRRGVFSLLHLPAAP